MLYCQSGHTRQYENDSILALGRFSPSFPGHRGCENTADKQGNRTNATLNIAEVVAVNVDLTGSRSRGWLVDLLSGQPLAVGSASLTAAQLSPSD